MVRYVKPGWFTRAVFNPLVAGLTRAGLPLYGSRVLVVKGRRSGEPRSTPVNPLELDGRTYLVAPRGTTQWVRNLRVAGVGELRGGRTVRRFAAQEIPDGEKPDILRAYLRRWKWEVGQFFAGVGPDASEADLQRISPDHPVFLITPE